MARQDYDAARTFFEESYEMARDLSSGRHMTAANKAIDRLNNLLELAAR
jgi:hypothetical protein